jgi:hypothetical protein
VLAGRTLSDLVRSAVTLTLMVAAGFGIGFRPQTGLGGLLGALAVARLFGYAWSWRWRCGGCCRRRGPSPDTSPRLVWAAVRAYRRTLS